MSDTIGGKINLAVLDHVIMKKKGKTGEVECIVIPIEINNLHKSDKGNVYLDLVAFKLKDPKYKDTHLVKQSLPKEIREAMSEEEKKNQPILGNLNTNMGGGEASPANAGGEGVVVDENDDLPF